MGGGGWKERFLPGTNQQRHTELRACSIWWKQMIHHLKKQEMRLEIYLGLVIEVFERFAKSFENNLILNWCSKVTPNVYEVWGFRSVLVNKTVLSQWAGETVKVISFQLSRTKTNLSQSQRWCGVNDIVSERMDSDGNHRDGTVSVEARVKDWGWGGDFECICPLRSKRNWGGINWMRVGMIQGTVG